MRVYLSVPMIANRALDRASILASAIVDSGNEVSSPWVLEGLGSQGNGVNVFERDKAGAEGCDALVADVSVPSTGVGMEIMAAHISGRRIILVSRRGNPVSRMLTHMSPSETLEYENEGELYGKLKAALETPAKGH